VLPAILEHFGIAELYPPQAEAIPLVERGESLLLAVPTAAVIGVGVRFAIGRYLAGPLYNGAGPGGKGDDGSP